MAHNYPKGFCEYLGVTGLKIEIGGGLKPYDRGYLNVDRLDVADVNIDLETVDTRKLPFDDDSVIALYTSHCLEHIRNLRPLMREIMRVCAVGAIIEIRVPYWTHNMAMCYDHKHVIGNDQILHWTQGGMNTDFWWEGIPKGMKLLQTSRIAGPDLATWRKLLPHASEADILKVCPNACHEVRWQIEVTKK
jgi:SAM-dependent methyltransferase